MDRASDEPPPFTVLVHGPPGVGKSTLIRNLVKHYTRHSLSEIKGPITVVSGKTRRLTFVECPQVRPHTSQPLDPGVHANRSHVRLPAYRL